MHILILHQYFLEEDGAGGGRFNEMSKIWTENGHDITVIAGMMPDHTGNKRKEYRGRKIALRKQGKVKVYRCHVSEFYNHNYFCRSLGYFSYFLFSLWAGLFKLKDKPDIVLATSPPLFIGITAFILSRIKKIPMIFEIRDLWHESAIDTGIIRSSFVISLSYRLEKFLYNKAKLISVLTPAFREILIDKKKIDPSKIIYIPNAADFSLPDKLLEEFDPKLLRKERNVIDKFIIVYVGAHGVANGLHQVLDAAERLRDTNVLFWLIGKGMKRRELIADANSRDLRNIEFIDPLPRSEVFKYIIASDMGLSVLTKNDTFKTIYSNKTFDYMACRKPVLMAIDGISRNLVEDADAGIYVEPENPDDLAEKVRKCIETPDLLLKKGENGYHLVQKYFDRYKLAIEYMMNISTILPK